MKALISDIHSNLEALTAVLADIARQNVEARVEYDVETTMRKFKDILD
jgi:hypothetical protein